MSGNPGSVIGMVNAMEPLSDSPIAKLVVVVSVLSSKVFSAGKSI